LCGHLKKKKKAETLPKLKMTVVRL